MTKIIKKKKSYFVVVFFVFIFFGIIFRLFKLKDIPFSDWDEAIYAQVAKEILQNKSLITTFNGSLWPNKPPLPHILIAIVFFIFGFSQFYSRMIFVIFSFLSLILTFLLSKRISLIIQGKKNHSFALASTLILASSSLFLERSTILNTDIIIAFSYLGYLYFIDNFLIKTIFLLFGVWSKSLVGFFPLFFEIIFWLKEKNTPKDLIKKISLLFFQIILASLWYIYAFVRFNSFFLQAHFFDQILKRVVAPIELHFGNKFYYFTKIWEDFNFVSLLFTLGYLVIFLKIYQEVKKRGIKIIYQSSFVYYLIILIPVFYLGFLTLGKSKIFWYLTFILPFLPLSLYPFFQKPIGIFRKIILAIVIVSSLFNFIRETYLFKPSIVSEEKLTLAACLKNQKPQELAFLVDEQERKNREIVEKSNLFTTTSFLYAGSPSFIFYSGKKVKPFYNPQIFKNQYQQFPLITISIKDKESFNINIDAFEEICQTENWRAYLKKIP